MKKKKSSKTKTSKVMAIDLFERKYQKQIEIMTEAILDKLPKLVEENYEEEYENAYEEAVFVIASEKKITII